MDAAEHDRVGTRLGGLTGEAERVADHVRDVLHLGPLVVVRQDHGVAPSGQLAHLRLHRADVLDAEERGCRLCLEGGKWLHRSRVEDGSMVMERSRAGAE